MKKFSQVFDLTQTLKEPKNSYNFNPSIAHWKDDLYFICYRSFIRYPDKFDSNDNHLKNMNHPWFGGLESETFWGSKRYGGYDRTGFSLIKIKDGSISLVKKFTKDSLFYKRKDQEDLHL